MFGPEAWTKVINPNPFDVVIENWDADSGRAAGIREYLKQLAVALEVRSSRKPKVDSGLCSEDLSADRSDPHQGCQALFRLAHFVPHITSLEVEWQVNGQ